MKFTKMQGIGNDYVYVNCFEEKVEDPGRAAQLVSDRHFGVGSDGLILIKPSEIADFEMDMYNADGGRGKMCGNGIRCVGKYVYDHGMTDKTHLTIATGAGIKTLDLTVRNGKVDEVRVDMGKPDFAAAAVPVKAGGREQVINEPVKILGTMYRQTCVSMGNPHTVVPVEDVSRFDVEHVGPAFENDPMFPDRVNTEFIHVTDRRNVQMRVWERGSGETWACGTGACAAAAVCILNGWTDRSVTVHLRGGDLYIEWPDTAGSIFMTGPARTVFTGNIDL